MCWIYYTDQWRDLLCHMKYTLSTKSNQFLYSKKDYRLRCMELRPFWIGLIVFKITPSKEGSYLHSPCIPCYQISLSYQDNVFMLTCCKLYFHLPCTQTTSTLEDIFSFYHTVISLTLYCVSYGPWSFVSEYLNMWIWLLTIYVN